MSNNSPRANTALDDVIADLADVKEREDLLDLLIDTRPDDFRDETDKVSLDAYLANLARLVTEPSEHLRPGPPGESRQPTWRWFGDVLLRAAKPVEEKPQL